jgi:hypothetical protein
MNRVLGPASLKLFALLMSAGLTILLVHDYAYRRADVTGEGDYELGGLVSHAGTDILLTTFVLAFVAVLWTTRRGE